MAKKKSLSRRPLAEQSLPSEEGTNRIVSLAQGIVASSTFDWIITGVILLQALALALEATPAVVSVGGRYYDLLEQGTFRLIQNVVVAVFIIEAALRLIAVYPRPQKYFRDGWNCFDFAIIILSVLPTTGLAELRAIVSTLVRSILSIFNIFILLSILFFIYAIIGYHLFRDADQERWSSFPTSLTTLFQVITLEGWPDIMEPVVSSLGPLYWLYFTSFIVIGTFIIINLFISVIVRKSEEAYKQVQQESVIPLTQQDIMHDIKEIRRILEDLEKRIGEDKRDRIEI